MFSTIFGGGSQRITDISVMTDPVMEQTVDNARGLDQKVGTLSVESKLINNKFVFWGGEVVNNYLQSFSTDFLFLRGDLNLRQSVGTGEMYLIEFVPLLLGLGFFFFEIFLCLIFEVFRNILEGVEMTNKNIQWLKIAVPGKGNK